MGRFYVLGPYGKEYEVWEDNAVDGQLFVGRTIDPQAMVEAAEMRAWDAVDALQYREPVETEPESHSEWLQKRFSDGAKLIKGDE